MCVFSAVLCSARVSLSPLLVCFPHWQSILFLHAAGSAPSTDVPKGVCAPLHSAEFQSLYSSLSAYFFSLFQKMYLLFFSLCICFFFSITFLPTSIHLTFTLVDTFHPTLSLSPSQPPTDADILKITASCLLFCFPVFFSGTDRGSRCRKHGKHSNSEMSKV